MKEKKVELEIHKYLSWLEIDQLVIYEPGTTWGLQIQRY